MKLAVTFPQLRADVEVIPATAHAVNAAFEHVLTGDVQSRFVIRW
jgi:hypothetical protein